MASPVTVRHPLAQRSINTQSFTTSTTSTPSTYKPLVGQKRTHSQSTGQENSNHVNGNSHNIQQQILTNPATFKQPSVPRHPHYALQAAAPQKCRSTARPAIQVPPQFKQPLPRTSVIATRQRQQTNDPAATTAGEEGDTQEVIEWRRQMKRTLSISTFYFDCVEESFKETSSRIIYRHGGVRPPAPFVIQTQLTEARKLHNSSPIPSTLLSPLERPLPHRHLLPTWILQANKSNPKPNRSRGI